jgi:crotonobetainyl-CoA:carnitine CoA-transferase CaiB-like acyl-CoA transferase
MGAGGVLDGIDVLDLSWGVAGPVTTMLLADHGARVTTVERPGGQPWRDWSGARVWRRGKRSAVLDLGDPADRDALLARLRTADVLVESFRPSTADRLGLGPDVVAAQSPRLVHCSITGYGRGTADEDRPAWDALVTARTGMWWEVRGWPGGTPDRLAGRPLRAAEVEVAEGAVCGAERDGPLFTAVPWTSLATAYLATLGISAALRVREQTGRGQRVETSLWQGAIASGPMPLMRAEDPDAADFWTWVVDARAPKGHFRCADGRWVLHWPMVPGFVSRVSAGDHLEIPEGVSLRARDDPDRVGTGEADLYALMHHHPIMAAAFRRFPAHEWAAVAAEAGVTLQVIRSPEEALVDPAFLADGCVTEVDDPDLGPLRQVGQVYRLSAAPAPPTQPAARLGEHTDELLAEAAAAAAGPVPIAPSTSEVPGPGAAGPLAGVVVLDLGLALAGPWGTQCLADLGADVIKVNAFHDAYWHANHVAKCANRNKRSLAVNLKDPRGRAVLHELVVSADVVHTNMREAATAKLGVDAATLRALNPRLIYCHTAGFERGERRRLPGNDQTGSALAGVQWEDGGLADDGRPIWSLTTLGDTGNGFLSAIGVVQALYHRDRTGEGQVVDTSIVYAQLLNGSFACARPDGTPVERPRLDALAFGLSPRYRLYPTADGWLCVAAVTDAAWAALVAAVGTDDPAGVEAALRGASAAEWAARLDAVGVPVEVCSERATLGVFDDPELRARRWVTRCDDQPRTGHLDMPGLLVDLSETPGVLRYGPVVVGRETREILSQFGFGDDRIDALLAEGVVSHTLGG